jgi:hypothetical protein
MEAKHSQSGAWQTSISSLTQIGNQQNLVIGMGFYTESLTREQDDGKDGK